LEVLVQVVAAFKPGARADRKGAQIADPVDVRAFRRSGIAGTEVVLVEIAEVESVGTGGERGDGRVTGADVFDEGRGPAEGRIVGGVQLELDDPLAEGLRSGGMSRARLADIGPVHLRDRKSAAGKRLGLDERQV